MKLSQANIQSLVESEYKNGFEQCKICRLGAYKLSVAVPCDAGRHCKVQAKNVHLLNVIVNNRSHKVMRHD